MVRFHSPFYILSEVEGERRVGAGGPRPCKRNMKEKYFRYIGRKISAETFPAELIRMAMMSAAKRAIIPMQDILGLGSKALMNRPATKNGNWGWRLVPEQITPEIINLHREMTEIYGRA